MKFHFTKSGKGKTTIVFFHYFGGSAKSWKWVAKKLKERYSIITVTLPGFGNTEPLDNITIEAFSEYINSMIKEFSISDYYLVGHAMGAKLILDAASRMNAETPKALILVCPSPPTTEKMTKQDRKTMMVPPDKFCADASVDKAAVKKLKGKKWKTATETPLEVEENTWKWWVGTGMLNDISNKTKKLEIPIYVICCENDPIIPIEDIHEDVLPNLKDPKLSVIKDCGHLLPLEKPGELIDCIEEYIEGFEDSN